MTTPVLQPPAPRPAAAPVRRRLLLGAAALVLTAGVVGAVTLSGGDPAPGPATGSPLRLGLPGSGVAASCAPFSVQLLRAMSPAFAGTVRSVDDGQVVLDVDRWYAGGTAEQVVLTRPDATSSASLDDVDFAQGGRYLVTAAGGEVNGCGYSGPATPDLSRAFDEAFPG